MTPFPRAVRGARPLRRMELGETVPTRGSHASLDWLRWLAVLPGAMCAGLVAMFPLHWIIYFAYQGNNDGFVQLSTETIASIEVATTPFVIAVTFISAGFAIAPRHKLKTAAALAALYGLLAVGFLVYARSSGVQGSFTGRSAGAVAGLLLGLLVAWGSTRPRSA